MATAHVNVTPPSETSVDRQERKRIQYMHGAAAAYYISLEHEDSAEALSHLRLVQDNPTFYDFRDHLRKIGDIFKALLAGHDFDRSRVDKRVLYLLEWYCKHRSQRQTVLSMLSEEGLTALKASDPPAADPVLNDSRSSLKAHSVTPSQSVVHGTTPSVLQACTSTSHPLLSASHSSSSTPLPSSMLKRPRRPSRPGRRAKPRRRSQTYEECVCLIVLHCAAGASFILYEHGRASEAQIEAMDTTEMMGSSRWFEEFRRVSECIRDLRLDPMINSSSGINSAALNLIKEYVVRPAEWESTLSKLQKAADLATTEWDELGNLGLKDNEGRQHRNEVQDSPFSKWLADPARKDLLKGELRCRAESFPR